MSLLFSTAIGAGPPSVVSAWTRGTASASPRDNDVDIDAKSLLRLTERFPPRFEQIIVLSFTMTMDQPGK
ncbi:hypothetical protein [Kitasatospora purpeofusca]|uniref:hypothetical protein n=1 Tax=Kitasatospora purpeofusca TaxID=67352 RepID=UPI00386B846B